MVICFAKQFGKAGLIIGDRGILIQLGDGTQLATGIRFRHQQRQGSLAPDLDAHGAIELDGLSEQRYGGQKLAELPGDGRRIVVPLEDLGMGLLEGNDFTTHIGVVEKETLYLVGHEYCLNYVVRNQRRRKTTPASALFAPCLSLSRFAVSLLPAHEALDLAALALVGSLEGMLHGLIGLTSALGSFVRRASLSAVSR